ncbi:hypothetical protein KCU59_g162, partial [Aureobasidium melanogenum]
LVSQRSANPNTNRCLPPTLRDIFPFCLRCFCLGIHLFGRHRLPLVLAVFRRPATAFCIVSEVVLPISLAFPSHSALVSFCQPTRLLSLPPAGACMVYWIYCKLAQVAGSCRPSGPLGCHRFKINFRLIKSRRQLLDIPFCLLIIYVRQSETVFEKLTDNSNRDGDKRDFLIRFTWTLTITCIAPEAACVSGWSVELYSPHRGPETNMCQNHMRERLRLLRFVHQQSTLQTLLLPELPILCSQATGQLLTLLQRSTKETLQPVSLKRLTDSAEKHTLSLKARASGSCLCQVQPSMVVNNLARLCWHFLAQSVRKVILSNVPWLEESLVTHAKTSLDETPLRQEPRLIRDKIEINLSRHEGPLPRQIRNVWLQSRSEQLDDGECFETFNLLTATWQVRQSILSEALHVVKACWQNYGQRPRRKQVPDKACHFLWALVFCGSGGEEMTSRHSRRFSMVEASIVHYATLRTEAR